MTAPPDAVRGATIAGTGRYLPERVLTNFDLERIVDTSDEWIRERTGIRERRIAAPDQASSDLAAIAANQALAAAAVPAAEIDHIILATTTPDRVLPTCGCTLQEKIGARRAAAYDVFAACSGFVYGLGLGHGLIASRAADTVLVVGVETLSRITDYADRNTCVLFGDGAGAVVLRPCAAGDGILATRMRSDGAYGEILEVPAGGSRWPADHDSIDARAHFIRMRGKELFKIAVRAMEESTREALAAAGLTPADLEIMIPHQANLRIIDAVRERLQLAAERVPVNIDRYGNTSSASIPITLDELAREGRLRPGDRVGFCAFGGGATWGASVMRWTMARRGAEAATAGAGGLAEVRSAP